MKSILLTIGIALSALSISAQSDLDEIRTGNEFYQEKNYPQAEQAYRRALEINPKSTTALFNLGNALYRAGKRDEAEKIFQQLAENERDPKTKSESWYNAGVMDTKQKKLEESIESYKNALRQNPDDKEARENLQKALLEKKKQDEQNQQQKKQDQPQKPKSKLNNKQAEQKLELLKEKEKQVQERLNKKPNTGSEPKDW